MALFQWARRLRGESPSTARATATTAKPEGSPVERGVAAIAKGQFRAAAAAFREAINLDPDSAPNHVNLAYALQETGDSGEAVKLLRRATALDASSFDAQYMLGLALEREQELPAAAGHLRAAVALRPTFETVRNDLCRVLVAAGDTGAAREAIEAGIALNPDNADFHHYLGNVLMATGEPAAALLAYQRALALRPDYVQVHVNVGIALRAQADPEAAEASFQRALEIDPSVRDAHINLGLLRKDQRRFPEAVESLQRAVDLDPALAETLNQLGGVYLDQGLLDQAIDYYGRAIALRPDNPGGYGNLGLVYYEKGDLFQAVATYRKGLALRSIPNLHDNLGIALLRQGLVHEAIEHLELALKGKPDDINTRTNLAAALTEGVGQEAGIAAYRDILERRPDQLSAHSNLLFNLTFSAACSADQYLAEARRFSNKLDRTGLEAPLPPSGTLDRPLRVGFVSGDLHEHPVGFFLEGILNHLDPKRFELLAYPTAAKQDGLSIRIKPRFAQWRLIRGMSDLAAARLIREDGVDILIDLAGHSGDNRLPMFALRPAPVQMSWLGYFASTGVAEMDYILLDEQCLPAGDEHLVSERVWRVPQTRLCYTPPPNTAPPVAPLPALSRGHITFGCFQRFIKINDAVLQLWGRVFAALPDARLVLQCQQCVNPVLVEAMRRRLAGVGVAADRVDFRPPAPMAAYFKSYAAIDIALDTFPFNGGTTTSEALWMGVPTLTLPGDSILSRQGAAMMRAAGLPNWVAKDTDEFVSKAGAFGADIAALAALRDSLREQLRTSPLFDTKQFAQSLATALLGVWHDSIVRDAIGRPAAGIDTSREHE